MNTTIFKQTLGLRASNLFDLTRRRLDDQPAKAADYQRIIGQIPLIMPSRVDLTADRIIIGTPEDVSTEQQIHLKSLLNQLKPWRKGPFRIFGIDVDSEWNSALKWRRVASHMAPLRHRRILDVGCSNGYYLLRMLPHCPALLLGIEPYWIYYYQFRFLLRMLEGTPAATASQHPAGHFPPVSNLCCLPLRLAELTSLQNAFDSCFCMGVLYHSRSPLEILTRLHRLLVLHGELILETLIIEGRGDDALRPKDRYAGMRNIYQIPTIGRLKKWLDQCGFERIRCVDITRTTLAEQHKTAWIDSHSLDAFLNPADPTLTIEGYPAPVRAVILANRR